MLKAYASCISAVKTGPIFELYKDENKYFPFPPFLDSYVGWIFLTLSNFFFFFCFLPVCQMLSLHEMIVYCPFKSSHSSENFHPPLCLFNLSDPSRPPEVLLHPGSSPGDLKPRQHCPVEMARHYPRTMPLERCPFCPKVYSFYAKG